MEASSIPTEQSSTLTLDKRLEVERNFARVVCDLAVLVEKYFNLRRRIAQIPALTRAQAQLLSLLALGDGVTQTELVEQLSIEKSALGNLLDKLEAGQWVERKTDSLDRRSKRVYLTAKIQDYNEPLRQIAQDLHSAALVGIEAEQRDVVIDILLQTAQNLKRALHKI